MRLPENPSSQVAVVAAATIAAGVAGAGATYEAVDLLTTTPAEHNAQVRACAGELGEKATRHVGLPDACEPFETSFKFRGRWVTVRNNTGTGVPAFDTWHEKVFDRPSADAFREAHLEPNDGEEEHQIELAALGAGILAAASTLAGMAGRLASRQRAQ